MRNFLGGLGKAGLLVAMAPVLLFAAGLPGDVYISQFWRDAISTHSPVINPAYMSDENAPAVRGVLAPTLGGAFTLAEYGATVPVSNMQTVGLSRFALSSKDAIQSTSYNIYTGKIDSTDESFKDNRSVTMLSYSIRPFNRLSLGTNVGIFNTTIDKQTGMSLDIGATFRFSHRFVGENLIGVIMNNLISKSVTGTKTQASDLRISWNGSYWENRLFAGVDMNIKDVFDQAKDVTSSRSSAASSGTKKVSVDYNARFGFWIFHAVNLFYTFGTDYRPPLMVLPSGIAINLPAVCAGQDLQAGFNITHNTVSDQTIASFFTRFNLGPSRERMFARLQSTAP